MNKSAERVRALVESGALSSAEGQKLIDALERPRTSGSGWFALLVDPFERFGGPVAAALGVVIALLSAATSYFGRIRYDGFLDIHTQGDTPRVLACAVDQFGAFVVPAMIAWAVALAAGRRTRFIDLLGAVGLSRGPYLVAGIVAGAVPVPKGSNGPLTWLVVSVALGAIAWSLTLHYQGFRNATGLAGRRAAVSFITFVVLSEIAAAVLIAVVVGRTSS